MKIYTDTGVKISLTTRNDYVSLCKPQALMTG